MHHDWVFPVCCVWRNAESWFGWGQDKILVTEPGAPGVVAKLPKASADTVLGAVSQDPSFDLVLPSGSKFPWQPAWKMLLTVLTPWCAAHHQSFLVAIGFLEWEGGAGGGRIYSSSGHSTCWGEWGWLSRSHPESRAKAEWATVLLESAIPESRSEGQGNDLLKEGEPNARIWRCVIELAHTQGNWVPSPKGLSSENLKPESPVSQESIVPHTLRHRRGKRWSGSSCLLLARPMLPGWASGLFFLQGLWERQFSSKGGCNSGCMARPVRTEEDQKDKMHWKRWFPLSQSPILLLPFKVLTLPSPQTPGYLFMGEEGFVLYLALDTFMGSDFSSFFLLFFFSIGCLSFGYWFLGVLKIYFG